MARRKKVQGLTPKEALEIARLSLGDNAADILLERIRGGFLTTSTRHWSRAPQGEPPEVYDEESKIPPQLWDCLTDLSFWQSGDAKFYRVSYSAVDPNVTTWCRDIRFDPIEIRKMFPAPERPIVALVGKFGGASDEPIMPPTPAPRAPDQRKPVSDAALKIWAEAFAKIHKGEDVAQPLALKSAEGMFPDKYASRDRITAALKAAGVTFRRGPRSQISGE